MISLPSQKITETKTMGVCRLVKTIWRGGLAKFDIEHATLNHSTLLTGSDTIESDDWRVEKKHVRNCL